MAPFVCLVVFEFIGFIMVKSVGADAYEVEMQMRTPLS